MAKTLKEGLLPFKVVGTDEPLVASGGLVFPHELARTLKLPQVIDKELLRPAVAGDISLLSLLCL